MAHLDAVVGQHDGRFLDRLGRPLGRAVDLVDESDGSASVVGRPGEEVSHGPVRAEDADLQRTLVAKMIRGRCWNSRWSGQSKGHYGRAAASTPCPAHATPILG